MAKLTWAALRTKRSWQNYPEVLLGPLVTGTNSDGTPFSLAVEVDDPAQAALEAGRVWAAGARVPLTTGQAGQLVLMNPPDSGVALQVVRHSVFTDQQSIRVRYLDDAFPTGGTLVTAFNAHQGYQGLMASSARVRHGVGIVASPTYVPSEARAGHSAPILDQGSYILPPGHSFGVEVTAPAGLAATAEVTANAVWVEKPI